MRKQVSGFRDSRPHLLDDPYLAPYADAVRGRAAHARQRARELTGGKGRLSDWASAHEYFGLHRTETGWVFREWAPHATAVWLVGDFSKWQLLPRFKLARIPGTDVWERAFPARAIRHEQHYRLEVHWDGGRGERIPAYARRVVQDAQTNLFSAQVWEPKSPYAWRHAAPTLRDPPRIYEAHVGMAQEEGKVGSYAEFRDRILPRIKEAGYNVVQLMAVMEHPYYGSFGYHVSSFFAPSSRFGTAEDLKSLVDAAHGMGMLVIMDIVHSHAVKNERDGLSLFDGTPYQYFHDGPRGWHTAWDSRCFDYGKTEVLHFLLSNCRYWLDAFRFDGYRFDGVTSMLYRDHGLGTNFTGYAQYFDGNVDDDAWCYLALANRVIHEAHPRAIAARGLRHGLRLPHGHGRAGLLVPHRGEGARRGLEHARPLPRAHGQARGRAGGELRGVARPGARGRQDVLLPARRQGRLLGHGRGPAQS